MSSSKRRLPSGKSSGSVSPKPVHQNDSNYNKRNLTFFKNDNKLTEIKESGGTSNYDEDQNSQDLNS